MEKKLYKSVNNKKLCGVCAGLAKYFSLDTTIVRLIFVALTLFVGGGILAYILCALLIPEEPSDVIDV